MIKLFLAGDVMTARGIDQILPCPGDPAIHERDLKSALDYVALAERVHGPIALARGFASIWGDALDELARRKPHARIANLETAVTSGGAPEPKGINYRMNPANMPTLAVAKIDVCTLANNHTLDWGARGLVDTLAAVTGAGIQTAGAGHNLQEASRPAIVPVIDGRRILVFAFGFESSGIPLFWAATRRRPGVWLLPDLSEQTAQRLARAVYAHRKPGDIAVLSIHWGSNWGYDVDPAQRAFAHAVINLGACDILHGHSSHHARPIEVYRRKLILYGCGDFINDYEGIRGYEAFRGDLAPMVLPEVDEADGSLLALTIIPFQMRRFRLRRVSLPDAEWLCKTINRCSEPFGTRFAVGDDGSLSLHNLP
jgi:poly-gamma-glutamate capsule biosynthesis protein CapA/YwtB (metallophosphatase superfamily)